MAVGIDKQPLAVDFLHAEEARGSKRAGSVAAERAEAECHGLRRSASHIARNSRSLCALPGHSSGIH